MVKTKAILPTVLLVAAMAFSSVAAAETATESPTAGDVKIESATNGSTDISANVTITHQGDAAQGVIAQALYEAANDLNAAEYELTGLPGLKTATVPEDLEFVDFFDISYTDASGIVTSPSGTVTITLSGIDVTADDAVVVAHNYETGKWEIVESSVDANGNLVITTSNLSPFAVFKGTKSDAAATPTTAPKAADNTTTSATTGESASVYVMVLAAAFVVAGAVFVTRARKATK